MGPSPLTDRAAIVGIGTTEFARRLDEPEGLLAVRAIRAALQDAGITPSEVDGLVSFTMEDTPEDVVARSLGLGDVSFFGQIPAGGGGACGTIAHGAMAIATGQADVVVAWRSRKRGRPGARPWANTGSTLTGLEQWSRPYGLVRPVDEIALLARRYMATYGATREHLCNIAITFREHAQLNPAAIMAGRPLTRDAYFESRWISEPLCLFDNCLESDGAAAAVIVSAERAKDLRQRPVYVHSAAQGISRGSLTMSNYYNDDAMRGQSWASAERLWRHSAFRQDDVKVAQIYDAFTPEILLSLEGYGFCALGDAGPFTEGGNIGLEGTLALNTSGGSLSEVYLHGFNLVIEAVRQMRGTSTAQVDDAECCFVSSSDVVPTSALILRR